MAITRKLAVSLSSHIWTELLLCVQQNQMVYCIFVNEIVFLGVKHDVREGEHDIK